MDIPVYPLQHYTRIKRGKGESLHSLEQPVSILIIPVADLAIAISISATPVAAIAIAVSILVIPVADLAAAINKTYLSSQ